MRKKYVANSPVTKAVERHIKRFCFIRDFKTRQFIIQKLSKTLINTAKSELGRRNEDASMEAVLDLVNQYLFRLNSGVCIHDKRQDGYVLLYSEVQKMEQKNQHPQDLCSTCISPRVCRLKSTLLNDKQVAGLFTNIKHFV